MSGKIVIDYSVSGLNLYAISTDSTGKIWNGAAFEAINSANWTTYAISMTEESTSGIYSASVPAFAAGLYGISVRQRAGVSPATTDVTIGSGMLNWSGTAEVVLPADSSGVTTILADYARRTGDYATAGAQMDLVNAPNALAIAAIQAGLSSLTASQVWDALTAGMVVPGSIGKLLSVCMAIGPGSIPWQITVNDNSGNPIDGVNVWITTDLAGANVIFNGFTDALGKVTPMLDPGNYYAWKQLAGYTFTNPETFTV